MASSFFALLNDVSLPAWIDLLQWPAMGASALAAWLVASDRKRRRNAGFWVFLAGNVLWSAWSLHDGAWALMALQVTLAALNIRGVRKTERPPPAGEGGGPGQAQA